MRPGELVRMREYNAVFGRDLTRGEEIQLEILELFRDAMTLGTERYLRRDGWTVRDRPGGQRKPPRSVCTVGHPMELGRNRRDGYFYCVACERMRDAAIARPPRTFDARFCDVCGAAFIPTSSDRRRTCSERCRRGMTSTSRRDARAPMIARARELRLSGLDLRAIAQAIGSSTPAVCRMLRSVKHEPQAPVSGEIESRR